jgi:hypothetical protein
VAEDSEFEFALERMFAETPAMPDAPLFAAEVIQRVDRGWTARRALIGVAGVAGGLIGALQIVGPAGMAHVQGLAAHADEALASHLARGMNDVAYGGGLALEGQVMLMAGALAAVAVGFGLVRLIRES